MANTSGETIFSEGSAATLNDTSTLTVTDGTYTAAATTNISSTNAESRPLADFVASLTFSTAPADATATVDLYFRYINIDSTNDEVAPDADFDPHYRGSFKMDGGTSTTVYCFLENVPLPKPSRTVEVYLKNNSSQTMSAWKLVMTPAGYIAAA